MLIHKLFPVLVSAVLLIGCGRTFAPSGWLPETDDYPSNVYGGWMTLVVSTDSAYDNAELFEYKGEFLSSDDEYVYLLADSTYAVNKQNIRSALLELDQKNSSTYALWGVAFLLTPVINGYYAVFTGPFGIISGVAASSTEATRDRYEEKSPGNTYWLNVQKFGRFPQGIPKGIDLKRIQPKLY